MAPDRPRFVVATPGRSVCDDHARALQSIGALRFLALGTRRGTAGVPPEKTRLLPAFGLLAYAATCFTSASAAESFRFRLHPLFDRWVRKQLRPGDDVISSYGYANDSFAWVRAHGGRTFLDGGNSHPQNFWDILTEEHRRWRCDHPPIPPHHYRRSLEMLDHVDYVLSPSTFVTRSFLARGFRSEQIVHNVYPLELSCFHPPSSDRPRDRPLRVISTGSLSLRKGTPYLLEAFRIVLRHEPAAELWLTQSVSDHLLPILGQFTDLPINWSPSLPHSQLAARLRSADVFVLPSLEDGFARTVAEALACGLPVVTTPNTGASDLVHDEQIGAVVPICDSAKLAEAILQCWQRRKENDFKPVPFDTSSLSFATFAKEFLGQLDAREILTLRSQHPLP